VHGEAKARVENIMFVTFIPVRVYYSLSFLVIVVVAINIVRYNAEFIWDCSGSTSLLVMNYVE
jgi:hypothetical protein